MSSILAVLITLLPTIFPSVLLTDRKYSVLVTSVMLQLFIFHKCGEKYNIWN